MHGGISVRHVLTSNFYVLDDIEPRYRMSGINKNLDNFGIKTLKLMKDYL